MKTNRQTCNEKKAVALCISLFAALPSLSATASDLSARKVMVKATENRKLKASESVVTLTIINARGQQRKRKMAMATKLTDNGRTEKKLARFLAPADVQGTGFLTYDHEVSNDDIWMYMPALRKTRRILSSERSKSFMGSEFSYADMNIPNLDDYAYRIVKEAPFEGDVCWVIEVTAKNADVAKDDGYYKKVVHIGKQDFTLRNSIYYDTNSKPLKQLKATRIQKVDAENNHYRAMRLEMINLRNHRRSILVTEKFALSNHITDDLFTTRYLERE
jgi:hypothetical protein